jgi:tocopherol cyclase
LNQLLRIHAIWNPHVYHGWGRSKRFFEGWYYKIVNDSQTSAFAIIPGIAMDENGNKQSFIQVLDGMNNIAKYYKFKAEEFKPTPRKHSLKIGENYFSRDEISLDLPNIKGDLKFKNLSPWSNSVFSPGIMGPYSFIPFMECYHGIISMNHDILGSLKYNDEDISFNKGKGYMEKDWGHSFPKAYIWMQSNHFTKSNISLKSSIAIIPWMTSSFIGHIAGLLIEMENRSYLLKILAHREKATTLAAPISGFMDGRIDESMRASIEVELFDKKKKIVLVKDIGKSAGIEVAGKYEMLIK